MGIRSGLIHPGQRVRFATFSRVQFFYANDVGVAASDAGNSRDALRRHCCSPMRMAGREIRIAFGNLSYALVTTTILIALFAAFVLTHANKYIDYF
jgi:hypothetical protein